MIFKSRAPPILLIQKWMVKRVQFYHLLLSWQPLDCLKYTKWLIERPGSNCISGSLIWTSRLKNQCFIWKRSLLYIMDTAAKPRTWKGWNVNIVKNTEGLKCCLLRTTAVLRRARGGAGRRKPVAQYEGRMQYLAFREQCWHESSSLV